MAMPDYVLKAVNQQSGLPDYVKAAMQSPQPEQPKGSWADIYGEPEIKPDMPGNLAAGAIRGAGSIGSTVLAPWDMAKDALDGKGLSLESNRQRRKDIDEGLRLLGADTSSPEYAVGKVGAEIAGTAAVPGVLAKGASFLKVPNSLATSIGSSGFDVAGGTGWNALAQRAIGGGIAGAGSAAAVDPEYATGGGLIGGALPLAGRGGAVLLNWAGNALREGNVKLAEKIAQTVGMTVDELKTAVQDYGSDLVQGYKATVPQLLQRGETSQLQRSLKTVSNALQDAENAQQQAYMNAIDGIAPVNKLGVQAAAENAGDAIQNAMIPARKEATEATRAAFNAIDPSGEVRINIPIEAMEDAKNIFLGPGTFGTGSRAENAIKEARSVGLNKRVKTNDAIGSDGLLADRPESLRPVTYQTIQNLRSSIGEAAETAAKNGANKESAALRKMVSDIDEQIKSVADGNGGVAEIFPADAVERYKTALAMHTDKMNRFETGPQAGMFRKAGDGQAQIQGAEIPGKFYSGRRSQADDVKAFKRLVDNDQQLVDLMKQYAMTEGAGTASAQGNLGNKFISWVESRSGANRELLSPDELAKIQEIGRLVERGIKAEGLNRVTGSDTVQKGMGLLKEGIIDSPGLNIFASRIPGGSGSLIMARSLRDAALKGRNNKLAELLADPEMLINSLVQRKPVASIEGFSPYARNAPILYADR